jgi:DNA-binding Xre family transcriptional regulator
MRDIDALRKEVREVMATQSISARQIMRETGISHVTVMKFLHGKGFTHDGTIIKLCLFLGVCWYKNDTETKTTQAAEVPA